VRRPSRERTNLKVERTHLINQIRSLFALYGLVAINPNTPATRSKLDQLHTAEGKPLPPNLRGFTAKYVVSITRWRFEGDNCISDYEG
jgi:hypothetical protein